MALATRCPHCGTIFKVAADQLKLRGGIVRCGKCSEIFDGNASLVDLDGAAPAHAAAPPPPIPEPGPEDEPVYTLDFDSTFEPMGILPEPGAAEARPEPEPEPAPQLPIDFDLDLGIEPDFDLDLTPPPMPAEAAAPAAAAAPPREAPAALPPAPPEEAAAAPDAETADAELVPSAFATETTHPEAADAYAEEPGFVTRVRKQEKATRIVRILMAAGSVLLAAALGAQGVATFRNVLAARFPQFKPALVAACNALGCSVTLPAQIDALAVETGELQSLGGDTFAFATVLHNQGELAQAWPHLELALTDAADKVLARRVIAPNEYLPAGTDVARGFAPHAEQSVKLHFTLKDLKASGYRIAIFYP